MDPIPQDIKYHDFADKRTIWGIPNFWDVMSNLPIFFVGIWGLIISLKHWQYRPGLTEKLMPLVLSLGIFSASFGSAYYHLAPDNTTLFWDRLPMTFMFMPLFALLIYDFMGKKIGERLFYVLIVLGVISVWYWRYTESNGQGDLRLYVFVQFFPMLIAPFILWLFPKKTNYIRFIVLILIWYSVAKITEHYDRAIFDITQFWSGHTLKHMIASISLLYAIKFVQAWEIGNNWIKSSD